MEENKYSDPSRYRFFDGGAVYDLQKGRIVAHTQPTDGKYQITPEKGKEFAQRRRELGQIAQLKALAASEGIELPEGADMDELIQAAAKGIEAITLHMLKTFKDSKNLRGMAESYSKLTTGFIETDRGRSDDVPTTTTDTMVMISQFINMSRDNTVEGEILEDTKGKE
jgi:hypothetical protein